MTLARRGGRPALRADAQVSIRPSCRSGQTLALSPQIRVFVLAGYATFACARPGGRPLFLESDNGDVEDLARDTSTMHRIAGRYVAFVNSRSYKCSGDSVVAIDVIARRQHAARSVSTMLGNGAHGCDSTGEVGQLVLSPSGAMAWTETAGREGKANVRALSSIGDRILDAAPDVDVTSLRLVDGTLSWLRGGQLSTAPLG